MKRRVSHLREPTLVFLDFYIIKVPNDNRPVIYSLMEKKILASLSSNTTSPIPMVLSSISQDIFNFSVLTPCPRKYYVM